MRDSRTLNGKAAPSLVTGLSGNENNLEKSSNKFLDANTSSNPLYQSEFVLLYLTRAFVLCYIHHRLTYYEQIILCNRFVLLCNFATSVVPKVLEDDVEALDVVWKRAKNMYNEGNPRVSYTSFYKLGK